MKQLKQKILLPMISFIFLSQIAVFAQPSNNISLSDKFTGIWEVIPSKTVSINGVKLPGTLKIIRLRLCVENGILRGVISHPHINGFEKLSVVSQNVLSSSSVQLELSDKLGRTISLFLVLDGKMLKGSFTKENINFIAGLQNAFDTTTSCNHENIDVESPSTEGVSLDIGFNGTWKTKLLRTININDLNFPGLKKTITLKLCIESGVLKGVITSSGVLQGAKIISQSIVSSDAINVQIQDIFGTTDSLKLILEGKELKGVFDDGISFIAVKQPSFNNTNAKKSCMINEPDVPADPIFD